MKIKALVQKINEIIQDNLQGYNSIVRYLQSKLPKLDSTVDLELCQLLIDICSASFDTNYRDDPYGLNNSCVIKRNLQSLVDILVDINNPLLRGRVADILWLYHKSKDRHYHATIAIDSLSSVVLEENPFSPDVYKSWQRALILAKQINNQNRIDKILSLMLQTIDDHIDDKYVPLKMAQMIYDLDPDSFKQANLSKKMFEIAKNRKADADCKLLEAIDYLDFAAESYGASNHQKPSEIYNLKGQYLEQHADIRKMDSALAANCFYDKSLKAFQKVQKIFRNELNTDISIARIRGKITETNKQSLGELKMSEFQVDVGQQANNAIEAVTGKQKLEEVLTIFSQCLNMPPSYQKLKDSYEPELIDMLGGKKAIDPVDGRTISKNTPFDPNNPDSIEQCRENYAVEKFMINSELVVKSQLLPALEVINDEHTISKEYLEELCKASSIIPNNRQKLVSHGLYAGFQGDWYTAIHMLCPQFEHMIRILLKNQGEKTTHIDQHGIENEHGLSKLMANDKVTELLGENLCFAIKVIFTESRGYNLRNNIAHGLLDDDHAITAGSIYAWHLMLHLIIKFI